MSLLRLFPGAAVVKCHMAKSVVSYVYGKSGKVSCRTTKQLQTLTGIADCLFLQWLLAFSVVWNPQLRPGLLSEINDWGMFRWGICSANV